MSFLNKSGRKKSVKSDCKGLAKLKTSENGMITLYGLLRKIFFNKVCLLRRTVRYNPRGRIRGVQNRLDALLQPQGKAKLKIFYRNSQYNISFQAPLRYTILWYYCTRGLALRNTATISYGKC